MPSYFFRDIKVILYFLIRICILGGVFLEHFGGIKELYDVSLRLNRPVEFNDINESILSFRTAEIAQINERKNEHQARGGYNNNPLVIWDIDKQMDFMITHGVLSPTSWALLSNSKNDKLNSKSVNYIETLHTIENEQYCYIDLKYCPNACSAIIGAQPNPDFEALPMGRREELLLKPLSPSKTKWIFCYNYDNGLPIKDFEIYGNKIFFKESYRKIMIDYTFNYEDKIKVIEVGNRLFNGFLRLDAKASYKDEVSGEVSTVILELPKIKLSSNLSMRLGKNYESSTVSDFYFIGYPEEGDKTNTVAKIFFLDKELTGDYI